ncbi:MAG: cyclase family protein [Pseudomonadota bacterium]
MCDLCVIKSVKQNMLSRRDLFKVGAASAAAATIGTTAAAPVAMADGHSTVEDMTYEYDETFPTYFGAPGISMEKRFNFKEHGFNLMQLNINEHTGTHIDAPLHFSADGQAVNEVPVENLVVPLCVIDIRETATRDDDAQVTPGDLKAWISRNGPIPKKACVAMLSGWQEHVKTDKYRNVGDDEKMHFPGFHIEATQMLIEETGAVGMAVDTLSLDHGISGDFKTHYAWLPTNRWGIENIANLDKVPEAGATLVVGAPKHKGGTGGPARIFAMV